MDFRHSANGLIPEGFYPKFRSKAEYTTNSLIKMIFNFSRFCVTNALAVSNQPNTGGLSPGLLHFARLIEDMQLKGTTLSETCKLDVQSVLQDVR